MQQFSVISREAPSTADRILSTRYGVATVEFAMVGKFGNMVALKGNKLTYALLEDIICCKDKVKEPFAVINADDYYGINAYKEIHDYLTTAKGKEFSMVAFDLKNTLTENGTVARGVCEIENGYLKSITERTKIKDFKYTENGEDWLPLAEDTLVSMNLWGFTPEIFNILEEKFKEFESNIKDPMKDEFFLPFAVDESIKSGDATVKVFNCKDKWYGMTYRDDIYAVKDAMKKMIEEGYYVHIH